MNQLPKYMALANWVKDQIINNQLQYNERFYTEKELSTMFEMSRQTVRQAIGILEQEGYLERRRGSGTYVVYGGVSETRTSTRTIGVISTYLDSYIFPSIIRGIDKVLVENGYTMRLTLTNNHLENETRALQMFMEQKVDGLIVEPTKSGLPNRNIPLYKKLMDMGTPVLFFNASYPQLPAHHVCMNDYLAGKMVTEHLISKGHKRIAALFQADDLQGHMRYSGYVDAHFEAGLEMKSRNVMWISSDDIGHTGEDIPRVMRYLKDCTGLVCYNDNIAYSLISELKTMGLAIPGDLSVVGIDNADMPGIPELGLTTVSHPLDKLGSAAAENILKLIENPDYDATVEFSPVLIERSSVRDLN